MTLDGFRTEFGHSSEHGDALSIRFEFGERVQGGFGRIGIGVVAVVDELDAADVLDLQTRPGDRRRGETGGTLLERKTKNTTGGDGEKRVLHHVHPGHRQNRVATVRAFQNGEFRALAVWTISRACTSPPIDAGENDSRGRALRDGIGKFVAAFRMTVPLAGTPRRDRLFPARSLHACP